MARPKEWTIERIEDVANRMLEWFEDDENLYYQEFLAKEGLHYEHVRRFQSDSELFRETLKKCNVMQEARLMRLASRSKINPVFAIFTLKNKHGWADKQEIKSENHNTNITSREQVAGKSVDELKEALRALTQVDKN